MQLVLIPSDGRPQTRHGEQASCNHKANIFDRVLELAYGAQHLHFVNPKCDLIKAVIYYWIASPCYIHPTDLFAEQE